MQAVQLDILVRGSPKYKNYIEGFTSSDGCKKIIINIIQGKKMYTRDIRPCGYAYEVIMKQPI